jgi:dTDP-4-amino-4,6-dideoxygalactose transaminase
VKTITTGEGGAVTTNDDAFAERLRAFRHHGIRPAPDEGPWAYDVEEIGYNYRLTDMQAALGTSQLRKLPAFVDRRNALADRYRSRLASLPVELPPAAPDGWSHAYHLFPVQVSDRRRVFDGMRAAGIGVQVHYVPTYRLSAYAGDPSRFPNTEAAAARLLSLPMYPALTDCAQERVVTALEGLL